MLRKQSDHVHFKTSRVGVYKYLSLIVGFAVTVTIWPSEVVPCRDFILRAVATFWAMLLDGIYPGRTSFKFDLLLRKTYLKAQRWSKNILTF